MNTRHQRLGLAAALSAAIILTPVGGTQAADPPANDSFAGATPIALDFTETIDTTMATTGDPEDLAVKDACGSPPFDSPAPPDATVWYSLTLDETLRVLVSAAPPMFVTPGFNVVADTPGGFQCVGSGPVEAVFLAEAGVTYYIQSIDDQIPPDWDGSPDSLDMVNGGTLNFSATSLGAPLPEICPGVALDSPELPPGLNVIMGTDGDDHLRGTKGDDLIFGLDGNDDIDGRGGNDVIFGCAGDDHIHGNAGDDVIFGDSPVFGDPEAPGGNDDLSGGRGNDAIWGGVGHDVLRGGSGDDELRGQQGEDDIRGGQGEDFAVGGQDHDHVRGNSGNDVVFGGLGDDEVRGGSGDDQVGGDTPGPQPDPDPNFDDCRGGLGDDTFTNCESERDR